tara:strand:+ start:5359 stop:6234 length:876 start_codon:yes stop_codon:yes gene_type:complete
MIKTEITRLTVDEKNLIEHLRKVETDLLNEYIESNRRKEKKQTQSGEGELYFVLPDVHYPFENKILMEKVYECISNHNVAGVCISGDWLDLQTLGSYNAESLGMLRHISLDEEYAAGLKGIEDLESILPRNARRMFLFGNHEDRYYREINKKDNAKYGSTLINPIDALKLKQYNWEVKDDWKDDFFTIGDVDIIHGVYCNIHTAKKHLDMHGRSVILGHTHRFQTHYNGTHAGYNIGCLADINDKAFSYMPRMQREVWRNGFAAVNVIDGKTFVEPIPVKDNEFFFRGKKY